MFATEEEVLKICTEGDTKLFNEVLLRVYNKAIEQALCHIPDIVNKLNAKVRNINIVMDKYIKENPEFKEYKDILFKAVQEIEIEYTGMAFEDVLEKAKPVIEKRIALVKSGGKDVTV